MNKVIDRLCVNIKLPNMPLDLVGIITNFIGNDTQPFRDHYYKKKPEVLELVRLTKSHFSNPKQERITMYWNWMEENGDEFVFLEGDEIDVIRMEIFEKETIITIFGEVRVRKYI